MNQIFHKVEKSSWIQFLFPQLRFAEWHVWRLWLSKPWYSSKRIPTLIQSYNCWRVLMDKYGTCYDPHVYCLLILGLPSLACFKLTKRRGIISIRHFSWLQSVKYITKLIDTSFSVALSWTCRCTVLEYAHILPWMHYLNCWRLT